MKTQSRLLLAAFIVVIILFILASCKKDEAYYCSCFVDDGWGTHTAIDTVMASSKQEAKRKCEKLSYDYGIFSQDCNVIY